ncbi:MAG: MFS transporter [Solirubrobacterales bacterium]|nr:MFS transporter [Solirubrobacterales bacterium]
MSPTLSSPGTRPLLASSVLARLPLAMFSIALLVHAQRLTGSFSVAGAYAIASAVSSPALGRWVDRHGQTHVLVPAAGVTALTLVANGLLPAGTSPVVLVVLGAAAGALTPPLAACVRTLLPGLVSDPGELERLFALESTVLELTFVFGPVFALGLGQLWSPGAALALSGLVMLAGTLLFAAHPLSRAWRPSAEAPRTRGGAMGSPAIRTLVLITFGAGALFGATELAVTAAAHAHHETGLAGPLLGLWGAGSLLGGIAATRLAGNGAAGSRDLLRLLAALVLTHAVLFVFAGSLLALALAITIAGTTIAPTLARIYASVDATAPGGTQTEAFSWLLTASLSGASLGSAAAGALAQGGGPATAFAFVAAAGVTTLALAAIRARRLQPDASRRPVSPTRPRPRSLGAEISRTVAP